MAKLEEILAEAFIVEKRLPCPSGLHRRFEVRPKSGPEAGDATRVLSCAQYGSPLDPEALALQKEIGERLRTPASAALCGMLDASFEPGHHWMTSTLPVQGSVHDHLREHRKLAIEDVEWLLRVLASSLASAVEKGWPRFSLDAHEIRVDFRAREVGVLLPDMPLFGMTATAAVDPMQTMAFNPAALSPSLAPVPTSSREYVTPLAMLCCEMLGEEVSGSGPGSNERFRPIAALSAQQNRVLRAALVGSDRHGFETLLAFAAEFTGIDVSAEPAVVHETGRATAAETKPTVPSPASEPALKSGPDLLAGYSQIDEIHSVGACRIWTASHATFGEVVISSVDLSLEVAETSRRLQSLMTALRTSGAKHLVTPLDLPSGVNELHVIRKKPSSTLLDSLRQSRALEKPTVARILASIHSAYESLWNLCGRRIVAMSLDQFWILQDADGGGSGVSSLRLDAAQVILDHEFQPQAAPRPIEHFSRLTLHLLGHDGGSLAGGGATRFSPVPELDSGTNETLRNALDPSRTGETSLNGFLARITAALAGHTAFAQIKQARTLRVSPKFAGREVTPLIRVRLMPDVKDAPILTIVADQEIRFGRTGANSDFVTQFLPRSPLNDSRTRSVSRVQLKAEAKGNQIALVDVADANPSMIEGQRITPHQVVDPPVSILLACEYPVEFRSSRSFHPSSPLKVDGWPEAPKGEGTRRGGCLIVPGASDVLKMELAWLFSDIGLAVSSGSNLIHFCASDDPKCVARLHLHADGLWLEAVSERTLVKLANIELRQGEFVSLRPEDVIGIQDRRLLIKEYTTEPV